MDPNGESGTLGALINHVMTRLSDNSDRQILASDCLQIFELATASMVLLALKDMHEGSSASKSLVSAHW